MGSVSAVNPRFITPTAAPVQAAPRLQVDKVSLRYQKPGGGMFTALEQVSFEVPDQQFAVLVGPSGCGKSSLLYLTAGLNEPTEGEIYVGGQQVQGPGADRGMVFQSYTLFPWLTVRQNVEFGLKRRGMAAAQRKEIVDYYVNEVGLTGFADNYAKQLSGGMMQRVAIARALANDPQILLMDEPFGALDSQTRLQMQQLLLRVWGNSKKTVLFVTHDIDEAILLGDRVYVMGARPGRIKQILDVPIERPRNLDMVMERSFIDMKRKIFGLLHDDLEEVH
ncbi:MULTISPECIES: ABC transporter ATP-binding protein [Pseudomonas]|jgi:NitT/TauT family transport system ATP-binding protein|uniref:Bicarbonate transport ATP-binding protein CmpD n=1 Tax=Pseudomonas fluorescens TaxID=294 RepID=A0A5E7NQS9_PSEFL|nr:MULTISPECIES: ABC transporter ATP-binding protein [Pseudomonas]MDF9884741.1 NitT/TauT family transport system ATP-binding protein [Pseudomonas silensiensis]MDO8708433.1 ABC transporter ATP-binding protein [Pseudomonas sp.]OOL34686.1 sulfonate ABC transporter ATP-binding protein [Pseudomonas sp. FSL W5-0299]PMV83972.1 ABC transporter ATP-binding protein [Pseudomonas sp. FW306-2-2C-B10A]PMV84197.1 ABC transporter ATP-binding protein [Pseudomonas sp. GW101-1A09]